MTTDNSHLSADDAYSQFGNITLSPNYSKLLYYIATNVVANIPAKHLKQVKQQYQIDDHKQLKLLDTDSKAIDKAIKDELKQMVNNPNIPVDTTFQAMFIPFKHMILETIQQVSDQLTKRIINESTRRN